MHASANNTADTKEISLIDRAIRGALKYLEAEFVFNFITLSEVPSAARDLYSNHAAEWIPNHSSLASPKGQAVFDVGRDW
jgi:hypothetical protein